MCRHEILISKNTGELINIRDENKNGMYICNNCRSMLEYSNNILVKKLEIKKSTNH